MTTQAEYDKAVHELTHDPRIAEIGDEMPDGWPIWKYVRIHPTRQMEPRFVKVINLVFDSATLAAGLPRETRPLGVVPEALYLYVTCHELEGSLS